MKKIRLNLKPMMAKFEVSTRKNTMSELSGSYASFFYGKGLDFEGYRKYCLHDDSKDIDWKASIRSKELLIRIMKDERNIKVFFLFDVSDSMLCSSVDRLKCEYAAEVIAALCFAVLRAGDSAGLVMFSDRIVKHLDAKTGLKHYYDLIKVLSDPSLYGGGFDLAKVLKFVNSRLPRNSVVIAVSDFIGLDSTWLPHFEIAVSKFDFLLVIMVRDPVDNRMPEGGQVVLEDPFSRDKRIIESEEFVGSYGESSLKLKQRIKSDFSKLMCDTIELETDKPYEKLLLKFFIKSRKKWR